MVEELCSIVRQEIDMDQSVSAGAANKAAAAEPLADVSNKAHVAIDVPAHAENGTAKEIRT